MERESSSSLAFIVDTTPSTAFIPTMPDPKIRDTSPTPSSDSDEVLFQGRNAPRTVQDPVMPRVARPKSPEQRIVAEKVLVEAASSSITNHKQTSSKVTVQQAMEVEPASANAMPHWDEPASKDWEHRSKPGYGWDHSKRAAQKKGSKGKKRLHAEEKFMLQRMEENDRLEEEEERRLALAEEERLAIADYAENLMNNADSEDAENLEASVFKLRPLALSDALDTSPAVQSTESGELDSDYKLFSDGMASSPPKKGSTKPQEMDNDSDDSDSSDMEEDDDLDLNDDEFIAKKILGQTDEEMAFLLWEQEERGILLDEQWLFYANSEGDEAEFDANVSGHPFQRRIITREQLLSERDMNRKAKGKPNWLAMDGLAVESEDDDEDDDDRYDDNEAESDEIAIRNIAREQLMTSRNHRGRKGKRGKHEFPSATLMADVLEADPYGGFDIMDFDRPSLRPKKKGRKFEDAMPFELSDEELRNTMRTTWEADRDKKRLKKAERAELRSQGLLGRNKKGKPKLDEKYSEGMDIRQIKHEFQQFFASTHDSLMLPPMGKEDRKLIHELGLAFGLKTKSIGSGQTRAPTLIKTTRMVDFDDVVFLQVCREYQDHGFLPRLDHRSRFSGKKNPGKRKLARMAGGGGGTKSGVSYQNGEVVGGSAPEIGVENKGRAMLEKLGWTKGMALGAIGNEGILQPVAHVVKTGKAGLG